MDEKSQAEIKQKAGRGVFVLIFRYGLNFVFNFAGSIILVRMLGAGTWGKYALTYFILTSFGFLAYGIWGYIIQRPEAPAKELGMCFVLEQALSCLWAVIILLLLLPWLMRRFGGEDAGIMVIGAVIGGYFYSWRWLLSAWQERKMDYVGVGASEVIDALVFNAVAVTFALGGHGVLGIAAGNALRGFASTLYLFFRARLKIEFVFDWAGFKEIWKFGFPFFTYAFLQWLPTQILPITVGFFLGPAALGYVNIAYKFMEYPRAMVALITRVIMSYYSRLAVDIEVYRKEMLEGLELLFLLLGTAITILAGLGLLWVPVLYGKDFRLSAVIMAMVAVPFIANGCLAFFSVSLSARGKAKHAAIIQTLYDFVFGCAALVLIPRLKDIGLPVSEWVALPFGLLLLRFVIKDSGRLPLGRLALSLIIAAATIFSAAALFHRGLIIPGALIFTAGLFGFGLSQLSAVRKVMKYADNASNFLK